MYIGFLLYTMLFLTRGGAGESTMRVDAQDGSGNFERIQETEGKR